MANIADVADAGGDQVGKAPRRRARHKNSHTGCLTCKHRRVKCDEEKPVCRRCRIAQKCCNYGSQLTAMHWKLPRKTSPTAMSLQGLSPDTFAESSCLQYFCSTTLPMFSRCEPSPLWQYVEQELHHSSSIRSVATALGHEHQLVANAKAVTVLEGSQFHLQAVQSLCQAIADAESEQASQKLFTIVFHCLLLVILQFFRNDFDDMNIHLQHGLRIASQPTDSCDAVESDLLKESFRLLKQYSLAVALFNPLLRQDAVRSGIVTMPSNASDGIHAPLAGSDKLLTDERMLRDEEQNLLLDLYRATVTQRRPQLNSDHSGGLAFKRSLETSPDLLETVTKLQARHARIELAIQKRLNSKLPAQARRAQTAEARCMLIGIYLRCRWSGYACNYDQESATFEKILDKLETSLAHEMHDATATGARDSPAPVFALDLSTVGPLFYTAIMCRQGGTRRRAVGLLSRCPQQEGPWKTGLATVISRALIDFEERKARECTGPAFALTGFIPEHCRVVHYTYHSVGRGAAQRHHLRVFRTRIGDMNAYVHEDIDLS